jgi:hypothetical protein
MEDGVVERKRRKGKGRNIGAESVIYLARATLYDGHACLN